MLVSSIKVRDDVSPETRDRILAFMTVTLPMCKDGHAPKLTKEMERVSMVHIGPYTGAVVLAGRAKLEGEMFRVALVRDGKDQSGPMVYLLQVLPKKVELLGISLR